jgi:hypothetical protein
MENDVLDLEWCDEEHEDFGEENDDDDNKIPEWYTENYEKKSVMDENENEFVMKDIYDYMPPVSYPLRMMGMDMIDDGQVLEDGEKYISSNLLEEQEEEEEEDDDQDYGCPMDVVEDEEFYGNFWRDVENIIIV